jgi:serine phosphatase RsbU (regulator of sigma subunit)
MEPVGVPSRAGDSDLPSLAEILAAAEQSWVSSPALIAVTWGPTHLLVFQNDTSCRLVGRRELGQPMHVAFPELGPAPPANLDRTLATGETTEVRHASGGLPDVAGHELVLHYVISPLGAPSAPLGTVMTAVDVTAEVNAEQSAARARLVAELTEAMAGSIDPDTALQAMTSRLVPEVADLAAVYVTPVAPPEGGAAPASLPVAMTIAPDLQAAVGQPPPPSPRQGPSPWDASLAAGRTVLIEVADVLAGGTNDASGRWLQDAAARNLAVVPLIVAGELAGAVLLMAAGNRSAYTSADVTFLEDVTARAGAAIAHLRTYQQQRQIALSLQRALLPSRPPALPGFEVAARYIAGGDDVEVGGDWWEIHQVSGGRIGFGLGDVCGRGIPAAVLMGQARAGMRTAAIANLGPAEVLRVLDNHVHDLVDLPSTPAPDPMPPKFATAVYAIYDPAANGQLRVANAGHPPLLLRYPNGVVSQLDAPPGAPLGLGIDGYEEVEFPFPAGSLLLGYTDGLVESRSMPIDVGIRRLVEVLTGFHVAEPLETLADRLLSFADRSDDAAFLLMLSRP